MSNVIPFPKTNKQLIDEDEDTAIISCNCTPGGATLQPVIYTHYPFEIVALVCTKCDKEVPIFNGEVIQD